MIRTILCYSTLLCLCHASGGESPSATSSWSRPVGVHGQVSPVGVEAAEQSSKPDSVVRSMPVMRSSPQEKLAPESQLQEIEISANAHLHRSKWTGPAAEIVPLHSGRNSSILQVEGDSTFWGPWSIYANGSHASQVLSAVGVGLETAKLSARHYAAHTPDLLSLKASPKTFAWLVGFGHRSRNLTSATANGTLDSDYSSAPVLNNTVLVLVGVTGVFSVIALLASIFMLSTIPRAENVDETEFPVEGSILSIAQIWGITSINFAYGVAVCTMGVFLLPKEAQTMFPDHPGLALGLFEVLWSFSMLIGPLAGRISDSLKHPMGRRRPIIHISTHLCAIMTVVMWIASLYSLRYLFAILIPLQQMMLNALNASQTALLADMVHPSRKDVASAFQVAGCLSGAIVSIATFQGFAIEDMDYRLNYPIMILISWFMLPLTHITSPEQPSERLSLPDPLDMCEPRAAIRSVFLVGDVRSPDFVLITKERAVYYAGVASKAFIFFFIKDGLGVTNEAEQAIFLGEIALTSACAATMAGMVTSIIFSMTKIRPQSIACFGGFLMAFSCQFWGVSYMKSLDMRKMLMLFQIAGYGAGQGCYLAADLALAIGTMPDPNEASRYMGLWGLSAFIGGGLGSLGTSALMEIFGRAVPEHMGIKLGEGCYHIWGYMALLISSFCCDAYVGLVCYGIRTRDEYNNPQGAPDMELNPQDAS